MEEEITLTAIIHFIASTLSYSPRSPFLLSSRAITFETCSRLRWEGEGGECRARGGG
jgi:hypothetical protein